MLPLGALDKPVSMLSPSGAGAASPLFENDEDAGQEDDGDYDGECEEGEEEGVKAVSVRLRLGKVLRYTIDYTKRDEYALFPFRIHCMVLTCGSPISIETTQAWYILGLPARDYRAYFASFFRAHKIAQALVCALIRDANMSLDAFVSELEAGTGTALALLGSGGMCTPGDLQDAVRILTPLHSRS